MTGSLSSNSFKNTFWLFQKANPGSSPSSDGGLMTVKENPCLNMLNFDGGIFSSASHSRFQSSSPLMSVKSDKSSYQFGKNETQNGVNTSSVLRERFSLSYSPYPIHDTMVNTTL